MLALFAVGCTQPAPGKLQVNVGQVDDGEGGAGGEGDSTGAGGDPTSSATTAATTTSASGGGVSQQATYTISFDTSAPAVDLDDAVEMMITVSPNGYVGSISLTINNLGNGGITGEFSSTKVTLDGSTDAEIKLTLTTMSSTPPGDLAFSVSAKVATGVKTANATLTVRPAITIVIPKNANGLGGTQNDPYKMAFGDYPMNVIAAKDISAQKPLTVRFFNDDDVPHEVHAANQSQGFPHDPGPIAAHSMDGLVRKVNSKGLYDFYLHDQNAPKTIGRLAVQ
jgi:hypothetical protein